MRCFTESDCHEETYSADTSGTVRHFCSLPALATIGRLPASSKRYVATGEPAQRRQKYRPAYGWW